MKIDIEIGFLPNCSLCDFAHFMELHVGCKFKNEEMVIWRLCLQHHVPDGSSHI